jgi:hypothetical protein
MSAPRHAHGPLARLRQEGRLEVSRPCHRSQLMSAFGAEQSKMGGAMDAWRC